MQCLKVNSNPNSFFFPYMQYHQNFTEQIKLSLTNKLGICKISTDKHKAVLTSSEVTLGASRIIEVVNPSRRKQCSGEDSSLSQALAINHSMGS